MLEDLFANRLWRTGYEFEHRESLDGLDGAIVVMPARAQADRLIQLNEDLGRLSWVILMLTGDEEAVFPVEEVRHPNIEIWVMSPRPGRHDRYAKLGTGYPPHFSDLLPVTAPAKTLDWFFAGQVTHARREACVAALGKMTGGQFLATAGFTAGLEPADYAVEMARAKVVPCPSGPCTPDTFRLFEALQAGCVPVADTRVPNGGFPDDYWTFFFGEAPPFPVVTDFVDLPVFVGRELDAYPAHHNQVGVWWIRMKRQMALTLAEQVRALSHIAPTAPTITVLITSSPSVIHPSTALIEETIATVRVHLPDVEVILMLDGIRDENEDRREDYEEYQRRVLWLCQHQWHDVLPWRFEDFRHQSGMTADVLDAVTTPLILFMEHDTPLTPDWPIEWDSLSAAITGGEANVIRLHHEALILPDHEYLMIGGVEDVCGAKMRRTRQWSQRPHLASTAFYRQMLRTLFRPEARAFIEHGVYGEVISAFDRDGIMGWNLYKLWVYHPDGVILRSYNLNGRAGAENFESQF